MTRFVQQADTRPSPQGAVVPRSLPWLVALAMLVAHVASAQPARTVAVDLPDLLPADVVAAAGWRSTPETTDRLATFVDEARRLEVVPLLASAIPGLTPPADAGAATSIPDLRSLADLLPWDRLMADEAWIVVTASRFDPVPAVTALARVPEDARDPVRDAVAVWSEADGVERREEVGRPLYLTAPPTGAAGGGTVPLAFALLDDVLIVSSDPEVVRFAARARSGADEPSFASTDAFAALQALPDGNGYALLDLPTWVPRLRSLAASFGASDVVPRLTAAAATAGPVAAVLRTTVEGLDTTTVRIVDPDGGDDRLADLLTGGRAVDDFVTRFVPASALSAAASNADVAGWWAWLDDLSRIGAPFGLPTLSELVEVFGVSLGRAPFRWIAPGVGTITLPAPVDALAGPSGDVSPLGATAWIVPITDRDAAVRATDDLLASLGVGLGAFLSPMGDAVALPVQTVVADVPVTRLTILENLVLDVAVLDDAVVVSTGPAVTSDVLSALAGIDRATWTDVVPAAGDDRLAWSVTRPTSGDDLGIAATLAQVQSLAGLAGGSSIDFVAVDAAGAAVAAWMSFVAERTGVSVDVVVLDGPLTIRTSRTVVRW